MEKIEMVKEWGFDLKYFIYERPSLILCFVWGKFYIPMPLYVNMEGKCDACYGLSYHNKGLWWYWDQKFWCFRMPWDMEVIYHVVENIDQEWVPFKNALENPPDKRHITNYPYTYTLKNGDIQRRRIAVHKQKMIFRWRWFKKLPLSWITRAYVDINFDFNDEVGEKSGSWKGGVLGSSYAMLPNETMLQTVRRMERDRKF